VGLLFGKVEDFGVAPCPPSDGLADLAVGGEGDAHGEAAAHAVSLDGDDLALVVEEEGRFLVEAKELLPFDAGLAPGEAELVQGEACSQAYRKGAGDDFEVEGASVALWDRFEAVGVVREQAGEDVEPAGGGLGVALSVEVGRESEFFEEGNEVAMPPFEDRAFPQLKAEEGEFFEAFRHCAALGKKACADPMAVGSQAKIEGSRLDLGGLDRMGGSDGLLLDQGLNLLTDEDSLLGHGGELYPQKGRETFGIL